MRTNLRGCFKKGYIPWNKGKNGLYSDVHLKVLSDKGKVNAEKRWDGHIKIEGTTSTEYKRNWLIKNKEKTRFYEQKRRMLINKAGGLHSFKEWELLKEFYQFMCLCCKRTEPEITLEKDHVIPISKGGTDYISNIQPLCRSCNARKHTESISYKGSFNSNIKFITEIGGVF